jgi:hypothetical protein
MTDRGSDKDRLHDRKDTPKARLNASKIGTDRIFRMDKYIWQISKVGKFLVLSLIESVL